MADFHLHTDRDPPPVLDRQRLVEASDGDMDLLATLTVTFLDGSHELLEELQRGIKLGDFDLAQRSAHSLKSEAKLLGGMRVAEIAAALEVACAERNVAMCRCLTATLYPAVEELSQALGQPDDR